MPVSSPALYTEQREDGSWLAECDGCVGEGATKEEAIEAAFMELREFVSKVKEKMGGNDGKV